MQVKPESCVYVLDYVSQHRRSLSQTICGLCIFRSSNPVDMNMSSARTPGISNFYNSTSDFLYLYLQDL